MEELHDHDLAAWEGEGGHHGERPVLNDERPPVPTLEEVRAAGYTAEGVAERIVAEQEQLLKVWLEQHPDDGDVPLVETGDAALEIPDPVIEEPVIEQPEVAVAFAVDRTALTSGQHVRAKTWTIDELVQEYFPNATRLSGGVAAGLQRELRRRNRLGERGY